ncbi:MAG: hypothetical protein K2H98_01135 [Duncaniella sp.]|nr:hypothetical protein [Duncaniella sp.]
MKHWKNYSQSKIISEMLSREIEQKEIDILNEIRSLTAEEYVAYMTSFPERNEVLLKFMNNVIFPNLKDLSLEELIYYDDCLTGNFHDRLSAEIDTRNNEIADLLKLNASEYSSYEARLAERLKYLIENYIWTYFVEGHKELNKAYAQIGIVPDNAYMAAEQYQRLVNICFPTQKIRETLQNEVDKFCAEINQVRRDYYMTAGEENYPRMTYKVPEFNLNSTVSVAPLEGISEARERFIRNREDISTGTSVLGWFFGGTVGLLAQGIGDWMAIDGLVSSEFEARKNYMEDVQQKLLDNFAEYAHNIISGVETSLQRSSKNYEVTK